MTSIPQDRIGLGKRALALLMAALYLILSTAGALNHSHSGYPLIAGSAPACSMHRAGHTTTSVNPNRGGPLLDTTHCAYCEWQASSVSPALAAQQVSVLTQPSALTASGITLCNGVTAPSMPGSRAPPVCHPISIQS